MRSIVIALCTSLLVLAPAQANAQAKTGQVQADKRASSKTRRVRGQARKDLAAAARLARVESGSDAATRKAAIERALEAFDACAQKYASDALVVAESEFRRGQLMAKLHRPSEACAAFERAASKDAAAFGARAWLEKAHVERRQKQYSKSLTSYRRAVKLPGETYAGQARLWVGKVLMNLGRVPDARAAFDELARDARADALLRVRAFDELAMTWIRARDAEAATRVLRDVETALATEKEGDSRRAKSVRNRLQRMRSRKSLEKLRKRLESKTSSPRRQF